MPTGDGPTVVDVKTTNPQDMHVWVDGKEVR